MNKVVVIAAELSAPPSSSGSFRDLTLFLSAFHKSTILVECGQEEKDLYYHWLKRNYLYDFIAQMVTYQENVTATIRINPYPITTQTYSVNRIIPENLHIILRNVAQYL